MTGQVWLLDAFLVTMQWSLNRKSTADHAPPTILIVPSKKQMRDLVDYASCLYVAPQQRARM